MRLVCWFPIGALLLTGPSTLAAQDLPVGAFPRKLVISERAIAAGLAAAPAPARQGQPSADTGHDSLKNGTITGAVIGGLATAVFVGTLCKALQEPSDPSCWPGVLRISALGAGIGAAAGAGIDAMISAQPAARLRPDANFTRWRQ